MDIRESSPTPDMQQSTSFVAPYEAINVHNIALLFLIGSRYYIYAMLLNINFNLQGDGGMVEYATVDNEGASNDITAEYATVNKKDARGLAISPYATLSGDGKVSSQSSGNTVSP